MPGIRAGVLTFPIKQEVVFSTMRKTYSMSGKFDDHKECCWSVCTVNDIQKSSNNP